MTSAQEWYRRLELERTAYQKAMWFLWKLASGEAQEALLAIEHTLPARLVMEGYEDTATGGPRLAELTKSSRVGEIILSIQEHPPCGRLALIRADTDGSASVIHECLEGRGLEPWIWRGDVRQPLSMGR
jgi:hypothetical protein